MMGGLLDGVTFTIVDGNLDIRYCWEIEGIGAIIIYHKNLQLRVIHT